MCRLCFIGSWKTPCSLRLRNVTSAFLRCLSWTTSLAPRKCAKDFAVLDWPVPESRKQLQCFLGCTNLYCWFFRNYSSLAAPLVSLTSTKRSFSWTPKADTAFQSLKNGVTSAPILQVTSSSLQFVVEVDSRQLKGPRGVLLPPHVITSLIWDTLPG